MLSSRGTLDRHVDLLLGILAFPARAVSLSLDEWDLVVRAARGARLLGVVRARLERAHLLDSVPTPVRAHLDGAWNLAAHRRQMVLHEMHAVAKVLAPLNVPLILLKGAAYIAQGLGCAEGRLPEDLDLMVPRERLDEAERALVLAGWAFEKTDPYDEHYYRVWSHELPPMRAPGHAIELDVHHMILPPTGRVRPDTRAMVAATVAVSGSRYRVLSPADQVLHACAHLFQDSDCTGRLRDLVDIDSLLREHGTADGFWTTLLARTSLHGLGRSLSYAVRYGSAWLGTPVPSDVAPEIARFGPGPIGRGAMDRLVGLALFPTAPDQEPTPSTAFGRWLLFARSMWLRMPPWLLAYHSLAKLVRGALLRRRAVAED